MVIIIARSIVNGLNVILISCIFKPPLERTKWRLVKKFYGVTLLTKWVMKLGLILCCANYPHPDGNSNQRYSLEVDLPSQFSQLAHRQDPRSRSQKPLFFLLFHFWIFCPSFP